MPGDDVMRTTMRSEMTVVPPVTAERSPPDSRITGRGLAGDGRLVDRGDAFDHLAVAGDDVAGLAHHEIAGLQLLGGHALVELVIVRHQDALGARLGAGLAQACRPAPCRAPPPRLRRNSRTAP